MSESESDQFEDAPEMLLTRLPQKSVISESRPTSLPTMPSTAGVFLLPPTPRLAVTPTTDLSKSAVRRDRLRGLRLAMRDEFHSRDGHSVMGDGDNASLLSENTSLHSWHRKVLAGPAHVVQPADSISTCAMGNSTYSDAWTPCSPSASASISPSRPQMSPQSRGGERGMISPSGPPPSHPPPPLPTSDLRTPPPVPPRNPSIRLPKPLSVIPDVVPKSSYQNGEATSSVIEEVPNAMITRAECHAQPNSHLGGALADSAGSVSNSGDSVAPTPPSAGRRRGHAKTNSLDRGLTLAKTIKCGPFPPPSNKSNSLKREHATSECCEGEEDERNQQAEGIIHQLTTSLIPEHANDQETESPEETTPRARIESSTTTPTLCIEEPHCSTRRLGPTSREARKSETILEESLESPELARPDACPQLASTSECVDSLPVSVPQPSEHNTTSRSLSEQAVDPITRDVERRMSMKGHNQIPSEPSMDDERSMSLSPTSRLGYAKSIVKGYASGFFRGAINKATHVLRPPSALKTEHEETGSESEDGGEPTAAEIPSPRPQGPIVRPKNSKKGPYDFESLRLVQDLETEHTGAVWCVRFSVCGRLMATAGQDAIIRIWVSKHHLKYFETLRDRYMKRSDCPPQEMFERTMQDEALRPPSSFDSDLTNSSPSDDDTKGNVVFMSQPFAVFKGHTADVLDLSWSKNNFVLSSGMDRTVKLWHITRTECLCCFQHVDFVTCVAFLPKDDRYFLSGSLDGKLRLWHIPDKKVALWNEVAVKFITALAFVKNGKFAVVGTYNGRCYFYSTDQLKYHTVVDARSTRGKNARGHKVTGLAVHGDKLLVTSNDSRIRMYDVRDMSLTCKFLGAQNEHSQIRAAFSPDGKHVISGSEDKYVYLWRTSDLSTSLSVRKDRNTQWERIRAHANPVCVAVFAPKPAELLGGDRASLVKRPSNPYAMDKERLGQKAEVLVSSDLSGCIKVYVRKAKPAKPVQDGIPE